MARADGTVVETPSARSGDGVPIYERPRFGFYLVVEGKPGGTGARMGSSAYEWDPGNPALLPDLQMIVSRPLGDGSEAVCDNGPEVWGGVPAAADFASTQFTANAISDLGCRFKNAADDPGGRGPADACTRLPDGTDGFWAPGGTVQFCGFIDRPFEFPPGDTVVSVRLRDVEGHLSAPARLIIRAPAGG